MAKGRSAIEKAEPFVWLLPSSQQTVAGGSQGSLCIGLAEPGRSRSDSPSADPPPFLIPSKKCLPPQSLAGPLTGPKVSHQVHGMWALIWQMHIFPY